MSKSVERVRAALEESGLDPDIRRTSDQTRTAEQAAAVMGCALDQIAKSMIFQGTESGQVYLFLTAGGNRVDAAKAAALAGEPLGRADAAQVRAVTGFAIGGVAPVGHLTPIPAFLDPRLTEFETIWAAAGTPHHLFPIDPGTLVRLTSAAEGDFTE